MKGLLLRGIIFLIGLFLMSFGVALSVKANLGISPIACFPYILSLAFPFTLGQLTVIFNIMLIALQIVLLRRKYKPIQLIQLPIIFIFGFLIDAAVYLVSGLIVELYILRLLLCLLGCIVVGIGIFLIVNARITYLPGEGLALAIVETFGVEFGKAKIGVDCSMVTVGIISSFILLGNLQGVREGTVIAAFLIGYIVKNLFRKIRVLDSLMIS